MGAAKQRDERSANLGVGRLFLRDVIILVLFARDVRHRVVGRLFGVPKEDAALLTFVAGGTGWAADTAAAVRVLRKRPAAADVAIGATLVREAAYTLAGEQSRDVPVPGLVVGLGARQDLSPDDARVLSRRAQGRPRRRALATKVPWPSTGSTAVRTAGGTRQRAGAARRLRSLAVVRTRSRR